MDFKFAMEKIVVYKQQYNRRQLTTKKVKNENIDTYCNVIIFISVRHSKNG
jgi:hypothetical protein